MPTTNSTIQFKHGLQEAFSNITKDSNTIYFITDTNRLFVGDSEYTRPVQHGSELPTSKNPANSLFVKETGTSRELYYSKDGTAWDMIAYLPATITGGVFGDNTAGTVAYGGTVKVPKVTVDNRGYVTAAEDVTLTLPTSDKVTTVTTSGDGNAVTGGSISADGATLTLTKGESFVPASGGTFSGDVTIGGALTIENITPSSDSNSIININTTEDTSGEYPSNLNVYNLSLKMKDTGDDGDIVSDKPISILGKYITNVKFNTESHSDITTRDSYLSLAANQIHLYSDETSVYGSTIFYGNIEVYGPVTAYGNISANSHLTPKKYVDDSIASAVSASDAMVFKGTVGTSGTAASFSAIDISSATKGDTYKVITADTLPAASSFDSAAHDLTPGDLIVYMGESKFIYVPSGDEDVTSVKVAGSGDTINVSTTAQTGTVVLGDVATKKVSTSTTLNGNGASNDNVPTELAVKTYVDDTVGALENTLGTAATTNATDYATAAQGTKADNAMPKSGGTFTGDVTVSGDLTADSIKTSGEITITPTTQVDITTNNQKHDNSKITFVNTNKVDNREDISIEASYTADVYKYAGHADHTGDISTLKLKASNVSVEGNLTATKINRLTFNDRYDNADSIYTIKPIEDHTDMDKNPRLEFRYDVSYPYHYTRIVLNSDFISLAGDVLLSKTPTNDNHAATKKYVDDTVAAATLTWKTF